MVVIVALFLIFSLSFVSAEIECSTNNDCDDDLKYTKDLCENAGTEESYCINEVSKPDLSLLSKILTKLSEILVKLDIIAEKNETINVNVEAPQITVEPTPIIITNWGDMPKRGNLIARERTWGGGDELRTFEASYVALPNGNCRLTIEPYGTCTLNVNVAKNVTTLGSGFSCNVGDCSGEVNITDEFYMIRLKNLAEECGHIYIAYDCS